MKRVMSLLSLLMVMTLVMGSSTFSIISAAASKTPNITVEEQKPIVVYSGVQNTLTYTLKNDTAYVAKNLEVTPDVSDTDLEGFRLMNTSFTPSDTTVSPGKPVTITLEAVVDDTVAEGIYPIRILLYYENYSRETFEKEIITYFEVRNDASQKEDIRVMDDNAETVAPVRGEDFSFVYTVINSEGYDATNAKTYISGLPEAYFAPVSSKKKVLLGTLNSHIQRGIEITFHMNEDTPMGSYPYEFVIEYDNRDGNRVIKSEAHNLFVSEGSAAEGSITLSDVTYPNTAIQDKGFNVGFVVTNNGEGTVEDMVIRMEESTVFMPKSASIIKVDNLKSGESHTFEAELVATGDDLQDRNYPIEFSIEYDNGKETVTDFQFMGVYVNSADSDEKEGNAPKIIISEYLSEPQIVKAGGEFDLSLDFMNTNRSKTIYNVKAYIRADESTEDTGNVFTPVGSSNTFYIDEIAPKNASSQSIRLFTVPDAAPKTYNLTINFEYEDADGNTYTATEFVGIPVTQVSKVEASDFNMPTEVMAGEGINVYFDIFNTGKAKVYNLLIKAEGNFTADPVSRYIGNFEVGSSDYYDAYMNFFEPGVTEGKFIISYDDAAGEQTLIEKPFSVNVMEAFVPEFEMGEGDYMPEDMYPEPAGGLTSRLPMIIGGGLGLVVIVVILLLIRRRKKKKDMELMFDEAE